VTTELIISRFSTLKTKSLAKISKSTYKGGRGNSSTEEMTVLAIGTYRPDLTSLLLTRHKTELILKKVANHTLISL